MNTFEATLSPDTWTEVLDDGSNLMFDLIDALPRATVYYNNSSVAPTGDGNAVYSHGGDWDFQSTGLPFDQRVWVKGNGLLRGVRG